MMKLKRNKKLTKKPRMKVTNQRMRTNTQISPTKGTTLKF
jgi:hypothetical protein